ncbi:MAG: hypothetical protein LBR44_02475 [Clostridiales Family XIII bacterium]|jgi:hypothetical protein|nr:hypothetical protein [Clostridiales Family XIII bacterium]
MTGITIEESALAEGLSAADVARALQAALASGALMRDGGSGLLYCSEDVGSVHVFAGFAGGGAGGGQALVREAYLSRSRPHGAPEEPRRTRGSGPPELFGLDERELTCLRDGARMAVRIFTFAYLKTTYKAPGLYCPACGQYFVSKEIAQMQGRIETTLEWK